MSSGFLRATIAVETSGVFLVNCCLCGGVYACMLCVCMCVWDSSKLTSTPPHSETDPWWQLLGEYCDVFIRLSKRERERLPGALTAPLRPIKLFTLHRAMLFHQKANCGGEKGVGRNIQCSIWNKLSSALASMAIFTKRSV